MSETQAATVLTLWRLRRFDTMQIAELLGLTEADVANVLAAALDAERAA
jgi:predicted transcriptional regulator